MHLVKWRHAVTRQHRPSHYSGTCKYFEGGTTGGPDLLSVQMTKGGTKTLKYVI